MIILGNIPVMERPAFLDAAQLPWWQAQCRLTRIKAARELARERGRPLPWFLELINEGMGRVAGRVPCVNWCLGPLRVREERRVLGLWPDHGEIHKRILQRRVLVMLRDEFEQGRPRPRSKEQQHWLVVQGYGYRLVSVTGKPVWHMLREKWEGYHVYGRVQWALEKTQDGWEPERV